MDVPLHRGPLRDRLGRRLKYTEGFTRLWPSVWTAASMALSFFLLAKALREIPVGMGYAVWTGIGAIGTAVLGMPLFGESQDVLRLLCIMLIIVGIVGLKLVSATLFSAALPLFLVLDPFGNVLP